MEAWVVLLPLIGAMAAMPIGRLAGAGASQYLTTAIMAGAALLSWVLFVDVAFGHNARTISLFTWIASGDFKATWAVRLDTLSAVMLVVINSVSFLVHAYSMGYMKEYGEQSRFFAYLSLFTFAMLTLVTADNFLQLFFGWEGVGLASYLLIGFWFKKKSANDAAIKAFVVNRVGDFGFALGIMAVFFVFGSIEFDTVFTAVKDNAVVAPWGALEGSPIRELTISFLGNEWHALTTIGVLLFIGAMGKSAQLFLHTWLPDAMEGPTPVSALIHAATMVTAGVFLVCRCSVIYEYAPNAAAMITIIGAATAFFAATVGLFQTDIKRVVAYSTCSQLGYMFFAAGVGAYGAAMFHLFTHAFFKALLFLGSGAVIIAMHHEQDMRKMGGVKDILPLTHILMVIGTIAITGVGLPNIPGTWFQPYDIFHAPLGTAGFVSKDMVLESAFAAGEAGRPYAFFAFTMGLIAAVLTAFYSWRLIFLTFWGKSRAPEAVRKHPHHVPDAMMWPLIPLALGALVAGVGFYGNFVGKEKDAFWNGALYFAEAGHHDEESHGAKAPLPAVSAHVEKKALNDIGDAKIVGPAEGAGDVNPLADGDSAIAGVEDKALNSLGDAKAGVLIDEHAGDDHGAEAHGAGDHGDAAKDDHKEDGHHFPAWVLWAPFFCMLAGSLTAAFHYLRGDPLRPGVLRPGGFIYGFFKNKWYFDEIYDFLIVKPALAFGRFLWRFGDGKTIDGLGPDGIASVVAANARRIVKLQSGYLYHYAFAMLVGIAIVVTFILIRVGTGS